MEAESHSPYTFVHVAIDGEHAGTITISDRIKEDSREMIQALRKQGVERLVMLSGDHPSVVAHVAEQLGLDEAYGGVMPDDKDDHVNQALGKGEVVGFGWGGGSDAAVIAAACG